MYILEAEVQKNYLKDLTFLKKDEENWIMYYHNPKTNEMWKTYYPLSCNNGRGPKVMRTEPLPDSLEEHLNICLKSEIPDDAIGAAYDYAFRFEDWDKIVSILENQYRNYPRKQLKRFIHHLGIEQPEEQLRKAGSTYETIVPDKEELDELARRAKKIRYKSLWPF